MRGVDHKVTVTQAGGLALLINAYRSQDPQVPEAKLKSVLGNTPRDFFRSCALWKKGYLRVENRRYFLVNPEDVGVERDSKAYP